MPNPILKVLSTLNAHRANCLLMGGQACVFYGAAEFSRDTDVAVLAEAESVRRLSLALDELQAECIALPPFRQEYLERGHAIRFRCRHPEAERMRLDVMSVMRGVAPFAELWQRRTSLEWRSGLVIEILSLADLVKAKKPQRDKDWPMIRRLVESDFARHREAPASDHVLFWFRESRTAGMLLELAERFPSELAAASHERPWLPAAAVGDEAAVGRALESEERAEREADRAHWLPLRRELEEPRQRRRQ